MLSQIKSVLNRKSGEVLHEHGSRRNKDRFYLSFCPWSQTFTCVCVFTHGAGVKGGEDTRVCFHGLWHGGGGEHWKRIKMCRNRKQVQRPSATSRNFGFSHQWCFPECLKCPRTVPSANATNRKCCFKWQPKMTQCFRHGVSGEVSTSDPSDNPKSRRTRIFTLQTKRRNKN